MFIYVQVFKSSVTISALKAACTVFRFCSEAAVQHRLKLEKQPPTKYGNVRGRKKGNNPTLNVK